MSKKIKLQDLSIVNFEQRIDVEGVKGGKPIIPACTRKEVCTGWWFWRKCRIVTDCNWGKLIPNDPQRY